MKTTDKVTREELLDVLGPIADLYHWWVADTTGEGHPRVSYYGDGTKTRAEQFAGISLTRERVLLIVDMVRRMEEETAKVRGES